MGCFWSGFPSPWGLPDPGIEHGSPALQADSLLSEPPGKPKGVLGRLNFILMQGTDKFKGENGIIRFIFGRSVKSLSNM